MNVPRLGSLLRGGAVSALLLAGAMPVAAQNAAVITGRVVSERGDPLGGATVVVANSNWGTSTASNGTFTITVAAASARGQEVTLTARYLGYRPQSRTVTLSAGTQEQNFTLAADPLRLDELVVTGVSEATSTKKLAFSVGKVTEAQLQEVPGSSAINALQGKVAGVKISGATGEPGVAPNIKLRGATSIGGRQDPLIIVDGIITRATLADLAGEDIERIEVVKGAAASSLYGSDAANGVIQIFTKRGSNLADGKLQITARTEFGQSYLPKRLESSKAHVYQLNPDGSYARNASGSRIQEPDGIADNPYPKYYDNQDLLVQPNPFWTAYVSVGQRKGNTNFNASFQNSDNQGIIFGLNGYERQNFRLNLDQQLHPRLDASFSAFYANSNNARAAEGAGSPFFGILFVEPDIDLQARCSEEQLSTGNCSLEDGNPDGSPYRAYIPDRQSNAANPLYELNERVISTNRNRFTGSARGRWRAMDWLTAEASFNYDQEAELNSDEVPFGFLSPTGLATDGSLAKSQLTGRNYNTNATLTAINSFGKITNTTKVAYIYEDQMSEFLSSSTGSFIVRNVPEFSGTDPATHRSTSVHETIRNQNFFAVTTFDINDRYILDGLIRRDGSSLFGPEERWQTYYRLSGAWRVNEDLKIKGIDEFRLRASYGTAGLRPDFNAQYETLTPSGGSFTKAILGNPNLKPARSSELEVGANLEFGNGKYTIEYTYAKKKTEDQILLVDLPSVVGFAQQWQNTGTLDANTHEVSLGAQLLNTRNVAWTLTVVGDRTRQEITEWNIPERLYGFDQMPLIFYQGPGASLGEMRGQRAVKCGGYGSAVTLDCELYDDPAKKAASGAGQAHDPANYIVNEEGYVVRKSTWRTTGERPIDYVYCSATNEDGSCARTDNLVSIGDANPDFNVGIGTTFNYKRLTLSGLVDWSQGGDLYNGARQWPFFENRDYIYDQRSKPAEERKPQQYYNYFYNGLNGQQYFVESATYVKLKELSVNYTLIRDQLRKVGLGGLNEVRLGLIGRNLFTFTDYTGYDPEVSGLQGDPFQVRIDWFQYPQFRTFTGVVEIAF
ncbi:MAG TPA: SusC/RagA family TonB-linked outer membrane protein [Gemmatimonadales bacterium]